MSDIRRRRNFIRDIILDDLKNQQIRWPRADALSSGAQRLPARRPRQIHLPEFRPGHGVRRPVQSAFRRYQSLEKEETEYVDSIIEDVKWLGGDFGDRMFYASDYFRQIYDWAIQLINAGKAYVCDLTAEQVREQRGTLTEPGKESPYRNRSVEENLDLFAAHEGGRVPRRLAHAARQDRHGVEESQSARSHHVPHSARRASSHRQAMVHLSDVRLRARAVAIRSNASRTRSALWNLKIIARSTTGSSSSWAFIIRSRSSSTA